MSPPFLRLETGKGCNISAGNVSQTDERSPCRPQLLELAPSRRSGSNPLDSDSAAARVETQQLAASAESALEFPARDRALHRDRNVGVNGVSGRIDSEADRWIDRHPDPSAGGRKRSPARVALRERRLDAAAGCVRFHAAAGVTDVDAAPRASCVDVSRHALEIDRAATRLRVDRAVELGSFDPAAGGLDA